ncbi:MAG: S8 family serine peptidase [Bryobacterales bacterium]|nr:S8 family serine peptidase [Bryobacterales bacterium]
MKSLPFACRWLVLFPGILLWTGLTLSAARIDPAVAQEARRLWRIRVLLLLDHQPHARLLSGAAWLERQMLESRYRAAIGNHDLAGAQAAADAVDQAGLAAVGRAIRAASEETTAEQTAIEQQLISLGATDIQRFDALNLLRAEIPSSTLEDVAKLGGVAHVGLVERGETQINFSVRSFGAQAFWNGTPQITGVQQSLAMLDSGVYAHPAIKSTITHSRFLTQGSIGCTEAEDYNDNQDRSGHGTHVAGVIAGQGTPAFAGHLGVAFRLGNLYSIKVACRTADSLVPTNLALYSDDDLLLGLQHAVTQTPAKVINISLGKRDRDGDSAFLRAIDLIAETYGVTIVSSAGNYGPQLLTLTAPGTAYNVISVGAFNTLGTEPRDDDRPAGFSSRGPAQDGRRKPDLAAPGGYADNMISQRPLQPCPDGFPGACGIYSTAAGSSNFVPLPGTSAAAAHVSGAAVLLRETGVTDPLAIKALLINSTDTTEWAPNVGWGYLNLNVLRATTDRYLTASVRRGGFNLYRATVNGALTASLVWNRRVPQGSASSLDDLDLSLFHSAGGPVATSESRIDNVEKVGAASLNGDYVLKVRNSSPASAQAAEQNFALATTVRGFALISGPALSVSCSAPFVAPPGSTVVVTCIARNSGDAEALQVQGTVTFQNNTQPLSFGSIAAGGRITRTWTVTAPAQLTAYAVRVDVTSNTYGEAFTASTSLTFFSSNCTYSVSAATTSFAADGGTGTMQVQTQAGCPVSIVSNVPWITVQSQTQFAIAPNTQGPRTGSVYVCGELIQILQRAPTPASVFGDVPVSNPFSDYISLLRQNNVTTGCTATTYCPDDNTTRGQMAVFMVRSVLRTDDFAIPSTQFFEDVRPTHPQFRHIQKLRELGITSGCSSIEYCPDLLISRGQMAVFLVRGRLGIGAGEPFSYRTAPYFEDVPATHPFFAFIQKMRELGITNGCGNNRYCPDGWTTRGQMAVFLIRGLFTP